MYGHQQGLEDGAEQANRRNRAHRDMEIWNEMEEIEPLTPKKRRKFNYGTLTISRRITQRCRTITS